MSSPPSPPAALPTPRRRFSQRILRFLLYGLPIIGWFAVILIYSAGERGRYEQSLYLILDGIHFFTPDSPPIENNGHVDTLILNVAFRRMAHMIVYAVLTILVVRAIQRNRPGLRGASLLTATLISALYIGVDELKRMGEPDRHVKLSDFFLDAMGIALVLGGTCLFFGIKALERRIETPAA